MPQFPAQFVADWDKIKRNLVPAVDKIKVEGMITAADKARLQAIADKLVKSFDKDLKSKMKTLATVKNANELPKAASAVAATADLYLERVKQATAAGKISGNSPFQLVEKKLVEIRKAAEGLRSGRPQATVPTGFATAYQQGMQNAVKDVNKLQLDASAKKDLQKSAEKLVSSIDLKVKSKINQLTSATDAAAAQKAVAALVDATEQGRKLARDWLQKEGAVARPIYQALDFTMTKCATSARTAAAKAG